MSMMHGQTHMKFKVECSCRGAEGVRGWGAEEDITRM